MKLKDFSVLYIEDDFETQRILSNILNPHVKELFCAYNANEALDMYNMYKPDIVITDFEIPFMDGVEISKKIKKINSLQPIIMFTAYNDTETLEKIKTVNFEKTFLKPLFDTKDLLVSLQEISIKYPKNSLQVFTL